MAVDPDLPLAERVARMRDPEVKARILAERPEGRGMFGFAGLFEWWADPTKAAGDPNRWLLSTTILTKPSCPELAHIHERNPVFLSGDTMDVWLDSSIEGDSDLLRAIAQDSDLVAGEALFHKVGSEVGKVSSQGAELIRAL